MLARVVLVLGLWGPPQATASSGPALPTAPAAPRVGRVRLDAEASLQPALLDALGLRLAPIPIVAHQAAAPAPTGEGLQVYVHVPAPLDARYRVEIIVSDGRAYAREIAAPEAMAGRILGGELALLVRGIEEGTLAPDRRDAVIPVDADPHVDPRADERASQPPSGPLAPAVARASPPPVDPRAELGLFMGGGGSLGVAPGAHLAASAVGAGALGLEVRWPGGGAVSAEVRVGGRRPSPFSVVRTRVAVGGGYVLRRAAFELPVRLWLAVEPWGVRMHGRGTPVTPLAGAARPAPLVGLVARAEPGLRVPLPTRPSLALRVGPYVELAGSAVWSEGAAVPRLYDAGSHAVIARLGGLELGLGLCAQLWVVGAHGGSRGRSARATP